MSRSQKMRLLGMAFDDSLFLELLHEAEDRSLGNAKEIAKVWLRGITPSGYLAVHGGGHDMGAWEHCISSISTVETSGAINAALSKLNARGAGHHYTLVEVISCGVHAKKRRCKESGGKLYAFRFILEDELRGVRKTIFEKNVKVCY